MLARFFKWLCLVWLVSLGGFAPTAWSHTYIQVGVDSNLLIDEGRVIFAQADGSLTVLALDTGQVLRRDKSMRFRGSFTRIPEGILMREYSRIALFRPKDFSLVWETGLSYEANLVGGLLVSYDGYGLVQCRALKGGQINWTHKLPGALQVVAEGKYVLIHRAATYEEEMLPTTVLIELATGKEIFRKVPPAGVHYADVFFDGTNVYIQAGPFEKKRADYKLERLIIWNTAGEEIGTIPVPEKMAKLFREESPGTELGQKVFWKGRVYPSPFKYWNDRFGGSSEYRRETNGVTVVHVQDHDLPKGSVVSERSLYRLETDGGETFLSREFELRSAGQKWTGVIPYLDAPRGWLVAAAFSDGKFLLGSSIGHVECVDAATGKSIWLYVFPTTRRTMSYSSYGMPPTMAESAAIFLRENANPPKSGFQLVKGSAGSPRIISDPDPVKLFAKLPLYLGIAWAGVVIPWLVVAFGGLCKNRTFQEYLVVIAISIPFYCYFFFGSISIGSSVGLRLTMLIFIIFGLISGYRLFRCGRRGSGIAVGLFSGVLLVFFFPVFISL